MRIPFPTSDGSRSSVVRAITMPISLAISLLTAHLMIDELGSETFAAVMVVTTLSQLLPFTDFGVGASVLNATADEKASAEERILVLVAAQRVLLISGGTVVALAGAISAFDFWGPLLGDGVGALRAPGVTAFAYFVLFALWINMQLGNRVLTGSQRNYLVIAIGSSAGLINIILVAVATRFDLEPDFYCLASMVGLVLTSQLVCSLAAKSLGVTIATVLYRAAFTRQSPSSRIHRTALPMLVIMIAVPATLHTDRLLLSHLGSAIDLARYSVAFQIYLPLWTAASSVLIVLWPAFNRLRSVSGTRASFLELKRQSVRLLLAGILAAAGLWILQPLVTAWLSQSEATAPQTLAASFALLLLAQIVQFPIGMYLTNERGLRFQAICVTGMLVVSVPVSALSIQLLGPAGPILTSAICVTVFQTIPGWVFARRDSHASQKLEISV